MKIFTRDSFVLTDKTNYLFTVFLLLFLLTPKGVFGQARVVVNPGLEFGLAVGDYAQIDGNFGYGATFDAGSTVTFPWYTSHQSQLNQCVAGFSGNCHPIEVWGSNFQSVPAAQGNNFVELNAFVSSMIYQNLYLTPGDVITYSYRHRARTTTAEQAAMRIEDQNEVLISTVHTTISPSSGDEWSVNQGISAPFTGVAGIYRVGFRTIVDGGSGGLGNLLDDIKITLNPLVDLKFSNALVSCEGSSNGNLFLRINGAVVANTIVAVQLIDPANGTAFVSDTDITVMGVANSHGIPTVSHAPGSTYYLIIIPAGNYDGGSIPGYSSPNNDEDGVALNIASLNDGIEEPNEAFKFEIKLQGTNGSSNNFKSDSSPIFGDAYYPSTNNYTIQECACYNTANTATVGIDANHGITLLKRGGASNGDWPMVRKSAHTVLESNTKGFVLTRLTTAQVNAVVSPQEGMMLYDTDAKCLKLYNGTTWSCFNTPTCP